MIIMYLDLFDIDFHIFTVIKFLFNLGVRFKYIYVLLWVRFYYIYVLLPLRLIFIRTYERDSDRERLREDVLPRFRALKCCDFLWTVFLRAFSFFALTLVAMLPESKWLSKVVFNIGVLCISIDGESQSLETLLLRFIEFMSMECDSLKSLLLSFNIICSYSLS